MTLSVAQCDQRHAKMQASRAAQSVGYKTGSSAQW